MAVTVLSAQAIIEGVQRDGRAYIHEVFVLSNGRIVEFLYLPNAGFDAQAHLTAATARIVSDLTDAEINDNVSQIVTFGSRAALVLIFSTAAQNFAALRAFYQSAARLDAVMIGDFLNTLTNAQLAIAFGITTTQAATLRTNRLAPAAALAASIRASVGQ